MTTVKCFYCDRVNLPAKPQYYGESVAHVFLDVDRKVRPCPATLYLIGENLQQRTFDRDEWWDL